MTTMHELEQKLQKADRKQAVLYLFCNFLSLMLISAYSAMMFSPTVLEVLPEGGDSRKQMYAIFVLSLFGCIIFTIYAASLFFRKKSRQLGVMMALGASRNRLAPGLFREVLYLSFWSSLLGAVAGFPFVWILWNSFRVFFVNSAEMALHFDFRCLWISLLLLLLVIGFSYLTAWSYLRKTNIMDVVHEEHKNEPIKAPGKWCGPAGIILLLTGAIMGYKGSAVYQHLFSAYPPVWINFLYVPVFIGLYMIMLHTVVHGWGRYKRSPYKNIIARSMMKFQGRQTVTNLLVSTVLIAGGCFGIFYIPMLYTSSALETSSRTYDYYFHCRGDQKLPNRSLVEQKASDYSLSIEGWQNHEYISLALDGMGRVEEGSHFHDEYFPLLSEGIFISEDVYNAVSGQDVDVSPGTYRPITSETVDNLWYLTQDAGKLTNMCTMEELPVKPGKLLYNDTLTSSVGGEGYYVLDNADYQTIRRGLHDDWKGKLFLFNIDGKDNYDFARDLFLTYVGNLDSSCKIITSHDRVNAYVDTAAGNAESIYREEFTNPDSTDVRLNWNYMPKIRILDRTEFLRSFAVFLMMFLFIAIICLTAALIICYTRCQTIALNNRYVFDDLKKLGASPEFLIREVQNQCGKVFSVPVAVGMTAMYFLFIMIMFANDNQISSAEIVGLASCLCVLLLIGLLFYGVYHKTKEKICRQLNIPIYRKLLK